MSYTLILDFNDDNAGNASVGWGAWYQVHVTATPRLVAPRFTALIPNGNSLQLTWEAVSGQAYQLQCLTDLPGTNWAALQTFTATNSLASTVIARPTNTHCYYRLLAE